MCTDCEFRLGWECYFPVKFRFVSRAYVVVAQREKTAPGDRASVQLEYYQSCRVEYMHGIAGGIIAKPDVSTSSPSSQLVSWPI